MKGETFLRTVFKGVGTLTALCLIVLCLLAVSVLHADAFSIKPTGTKRGDTIMYFKVPALLRIWYPTASRIAPIFSQILCMSAPRTLSMDATTQRKIVQTMETLTPMRPQQSTLGTNGTTTHRFN
jgi:hypothetical protein